MVKDKILLAQLIDELEREDAMHIYKNFKIINRDEISGALKILQWLENKKIIN